ncbi:MAG TPA: GlsB/YeaQ/YmgE family stress response membrane protein [Actinocatenispora sp.]
MLGSILWAIVGGAVIGMLARLIIPGRQRVPWWLTIGVGMVAAFLGTGLAEVLGFRHTPGIDWKKHLLQLGLAVAAIGLLSLYGRRRSRA